MTLSPSNLPEKHRKDLSLQSRGRMSTAETNDKHIDHTHQKEPSKETIESPRASKHKHLKGSSQRRRM